MKEIPENEFRILEQKEGYRVITVGKNKRRLSNDRSKEFNKFVNFLQKTFQQQVHTVYLNEHKYDGNKLYNVAFVFSMEDKK